VTHEHIVYGIRKFTDLSDIRAELLPWRTRLDCGSLLESKSEHHEARIGVDPVIGEMSGCNAMRSSTYMR
jgi:hypothetical protein